MAIFQQANITIVSPNPSFSYSHSAPSNILGNPPEHGALRMKNQEWLCQLSTLTGVQYYEEHRIFGDKSGALIGISDGYIVALGLGKADGKNSAIKMLLRYAKAQDPEQIKQALDPAKGKFKLLTDETTATLVRTYSLGKPDASGVADQLRNLLLGLLYGMGAAVLGSIAWGGAAFLLHRIFLWGAIIIGLFVGKAVVKGIGKVTWTARIMIGVLTAVSVAFGDSIFYALIVMKENQTHFVA